MPKPIVPNFLPSGFRDVSANPAPPLPSQDLLTGGFSTDPAQVSRYEKARPVTSLPIISRMQNLGGLKTELRALIISKFPEARRMSGKDKLVVQIDLNSGYLVTESRPGTGSKIDLEFVLDFQKKNFTIDISSFQKFGDAMYNNGFITREEFNRRLYISDMLCRIYDIPIYPAKINSSQDAEFSKLLMRLDDLSTGYVRHSFVSALGVPIIYVAQMVVRSEAELLEFFDPNIIDIYEKCLNRMGLSLGMEFEDDLLATLADKLKVPILGTVDQRLMMRLDKLNLPLRVSEDLKFLNFEYLWQVAQVACLPDEALLKVSEINSGRMRSIRVALSMAWILPGLTIDKSKHPKHVFSMPLLSPVGILTLSERTSKYLDQLKIYKIRQLVLRRREDLLESKIDEECLAEIERSLAVFNLTLNTSTIDWAKLKLSALADEFEEIIDASNLSKRKNNPELETWAKKYEVDILKDEAGNYSWGSMIRAVMAKAYDANPRPGVYVGRNLRGRDLTKIHNMKHADLRWADLRNAYLGTFTASIFHEHDFFSENSCFNCFTSLGQVRGAMLHGIWYKWIEFGFYGSDYPEDCGAGESNFPGGDFRVRPYDQTAGGDFGDEDWEHFSSEDIFDTDTNSISLNSDQPIMPHRLDLSKIENRRTVREAHHNRQIHISKTRARLRSPNHVRMGTPARSMATIR